MEDLQDNGGGTERDEGSVKDGRVPAIAAAFEDQGEESGRHQSLKASQAEEGFFDVDEALKGEFNSKGKEEQDDP